MCNFVVIYQLLCAQKGLNWAANHQTTKTPRLLRRPRIACIGFPVSLRGGPGSLDFGLHKKIMWRTPAAINWLCWCLLSWMDTNDSAFMWWPLSMLSFGRHLWRRVSLLERAEWGRAHTNSALKQRAPAEDPWEKKLLRSCRTYSF